MAFTSGEIRRGMDVYDTRGQWLGVVLRATVPAPPPRATYPLRSDAFHGESIGPVPTTGVGNTGPGAQPVRSDAAGLGLRAGPTEGIIEFGRWHGLLGRRRVRVERVVNVSISRVVVDLEI